MIFQLIVVLLYIFYTYCVLKSNRFVRLISLFVIVLLGLQLCLAIADPYNISNPLSFHTILCFNFQIVFFLLGVTVIVKNKSNTYTKYLRTSSTISFNVNKLFILLQSILFINTLYKLKKMLHYMASLDGLVEQARGYYFDGFYDNYIYYIFDNIVSSFSYISFFFMFGLFLFKKSKLNIKDWYIVLTSLIIIICNTIISLGRSEIIKLALLAILFLIYSLVYNKDIFKKKVIPIFSFFILVFVSVMTITTLLRNNIINTTSTNLLSNVERLFIRPFALYLYVPILAYDYGINFIWGDLFPMCGAATLAGIFDVFLTPLSIINSDIVTINNILGMKMAPSFIFPNSGEAWNALFTGASNYYIDFGIAGFILYPFLHGFVLAKASNKCNVSQYWFIVLIFMFIATFQHLQRCHVQSLSTGFFLIWLYIAKSKKIVIT